MNVQHACYPGHVLDYKCGLGRIAGILQIVTKDGATHIVGIDNLVPHIMMVSHVISLTRI